MAGARLEIYDTGLGVIQNSLDFGDLDYGEDSSEFTIKIKNIGTDTATNIRLFARTTNNLYSGQENSNGQEAIDEQWVSVKVGASYKAIGGDFGNQGSTSNYESIPDLSAASSTGDILVKISPPTGGVTNGVFRIALGVSYEGY